MRIDNDDTPWAVKLPQRGPLFPYTQVFGCNGAALMAGLAELDERNATAPPRRSSSSSP
jgi:hypothetical protein